MKDHTYVGAGCAAQYVWLGSVSVTAGSTFTAQVPERGYPLPISADDSVVTVVSRSGRKETFHAVAPGTTMIDVWAQRRTPGPAWGIAEPEAPA
ncbi:hypothetical protein Airi02_033900 [Actinoallomurus iriomotensis]|uniref:Uncharacterized protein n=1 Tax=Actinoallomurus iriomotensis TaxID=478107 RepID=A0A9W6W100_9ACTN|nr:hypothetical protein Airi02_033900 [Actinoallomurus iriomotensis]